MIKEHVRSQISSALKDYKQCLRQSLGRFKRVEFRKQQKGPYGGIGESPQWNTQSKLPCATTREIRKSGRNYSWSEMSSRKRLHCKQYGVVAYDSFRKSLIIHKEKTKEINV